MMMVCDIMSVEKNFEEVYSRLEEWKEAFEGKVLRISREKTGYLEFDFRRRIHRFNWKRQVMKKSVDVVSKV